MTGPSRSLRSNHAGISSAKETSLSVNRASCEWTASASGFARYRGAK
jgi:hypothetical protein